MLKEKDIRRGCVRRKRRRIYYKIETRTAADSSDERNVPGRKILRDDDLFNILSPLYVICVLVVQRTIQYAFQF